MEKSYIDKLIEEVATIKCPIGPTGYGGTIDVPIKRLTGTIERQLTIPNDSEKKEINMSQKQLEQIISYRDYLHMGT
jgi:hypothetical protein